MFEPIEDHARRIEHGPLLRFIESSQALHDALGIYARDVLYDEETGILRASLDVLPLHQGTVYEGKSIMYGVVIASLADMATGAAAYLCAGPESIVNHQETRIKYLKHVPIMDGSKLFIEISVAKMRTRLRSHYCFGTVYQEHLGIVEKSAEVWAKIPSMLEKTFQRLLRTRS